MKKTVLFLLVVGGLSLTACGPTAEEKAKEEAAKQAKLDSIANAASQPAPMATDSAAATVPMEAPAEEAAHH